MRIVQSIRTWGCMAAGLALVLSLAGPIEEAKAQWIPKWLNVGDFQSWYLSGGANPERSNVVWNYPAIRPSAGYSRWKGFWVGAKNVQDVEGGKTFPIRISHTGPRVPGIGEVFSVSHVLYSRYEPTTVQVDGFDTFLQPVIPDQIDSGIAPDRMVVSEINSSIGLTVNRSAMQWSHPDHENYHLIEYTFVNTGNQDGDPDIEAENNLEGVYIMFLERPTGAGFAGAWDNSAGGVAWGQYTMNDAVGDGLSDYGVDFRASFAWLGNIKEAAGYPVNTLGNPFWVNHRRNPIPADTLGRLGSANFTGVVAVHADTEAHAEGGSSPDDPGQPSMMSFLNSDFGSLTSTSDHNNETNMALEYQWFECGSAPVPGGAVAEPGTPGCVPRSWPTHARLVQGQTASTPYDEDPDFANQTADPTLGGGAGGFGFVQAFGPYDIAFGEEVKVVIAEGIAGLSDEAASDIGRAYKLSGWDDDMIFEFDANGNGVIDTDEAMTKNEWFMTARDSMFQMFQRAIDNYRGGLNAPHPPAPPSSFIVTSGTDKINIAWTAPQAPATWELYRAQKHYSGIVTALEVGSNGLAVPDRARAYALVQTLAGGATSYEDTDVVRGGSYYYYLQGVGSAGSRTNRYYSQTYNPAFLRRPPGQSLSEVRIVPNPYHLGADPAVRLDVQDRMAFYEIPGESRIEIYSELGELIRSIDHLDGSGDEFWDMTTSSRQVVASGIYIAVITDLETNEQAIQKFIVIR